MKRRLLSILCALALCLGLLPATALAADPVSYIEYTWNEDTSTLTSEEKSVNEYTAITESNMPTTWKDGWYVVQSSGFFQERITISGDVHLILPDGVSFTFSQGIELTDGNTLSIYGQDAGTGQIQCFSANSPTSGVIGGAVKTDSSGLHWSCGTLYIHGGRITASAPSSECILGIGAQNSSSTVGSATIYNGTIEASTGGTSAISFRDLKIYGGSITTHTAALSAIKRDIEAYTMLLAGGVVSTGGIVGSFSTGAYGSAALVTDQIQNRDNENEWCGLFLVGTEGKIYGSSSYTLSGNLTVPQGVTLTVESGKTLTIPENLTLTSQGSLVVQESGAVINNGHLDSPGSLTNAGSWSGSGTAKVVPVIEEAPSEAVMSYGQTPSQATFRGGRVTDPISGQEITGAFAFTDTSSYPAVGNTTAYEYAFQGETTGTTSYYPAKGSLVPTVQKAAPTASLWLFHPDTSKKYYTGGELEIELSPVQGRDTPDYEITYYSDPERQQVVEVREVGTYYFSIMTKENENYLASEAPVYNEDLWYFTVSKRDATAYLTIEPEGSAVEGTAVTLTAEVTATIGIYGEHMPTGTVSFYEDDRLLQTMELIPNSTAQGDVHSGSKVSYTTTELSPGTHTYRYTCTLSEDAAKRYNLKNPAGPSETYTIIEKSSVTGIRIEAQPSKLNYTSGDRLRISGLKVYLCYDNKEELLSNDLLTLSIPDGTVLTTANDNTPITITYAGFTAQTDPLTVTKCTPSVTAPTGNSLTYTGAAQELVSGGATNGGTLVYSLEQDGEYTEAIPTGVNAGEYTVWYKVIGDEDYEGTEPSGPVTVTIAKADAAVTVTPIEGLTYTGQPQALVTGTITGGTLMYSLTGGDDYTADIPTGTNVGDYTVWYKVNGGENYNDTTAQSVSVSIGKAAATVAKAPEAVTGLTYNGQAHNLVTAGEAEGGELQYSLSENDGYSADIPTGTDVGTYTVWYKVVGDDDHSDTQPVKIEVIIAGGSITNAVVELSQNEFTYTGTEQKPGVTVKLGDKLLTENTDYTVSFDGDTTNVGTVTVTVTGAGNNAGSTAASKPTYTIKPAEITISGATLAEKTYDGTTDAQVERVEFTGLVSGENLALGADYTAAAVFDTAGAGDDKTAAVTVTLNHDNYTLTGGTYQLTGQTIAKADIGVTSAGGYVNADKFSTLALPALPAGASYGEAQYTGGDDAITGLSVSGTTLSYTGGGTITSGSTYKITVQVNGGNNYESTELTVTLTGTDKPIVDITGVAAATGLVYNGAAQTGYDGNPAAEGYSGDFDMTYNADPVNAGSYTVTIAVPNGEAVIGSLTLSFIIEKAPITVTAPSLDIPVGDPIPDLSGLNCTITGLVGSDTLSGVALAYGGTPDNSRPGSCTIVASGGTFTTGSADNYTIQYQSGTLTVEEKEPDTYLVTIQNGGTGATGGGSYEAGDTVTVTAGTKSGYTFQSWIAEGVTLNNPASADITFIMPNNAVTLTANWTQNSSGGGGGDGGSSSGGSTSNTTTETTKNPDGSTTTTTTKTDGTVTETTKWPDGSKEVVETKKDGTVTTTTTDTEGNQTQVVESPDGSSKTTVDNKDGSGSVTVVDADGNVVSSATLSQAAVDAAQEKGEAVALPMPVVPVTTDWETAPTVTVDLPVGGSVKVEVPVDDVTPGTVAVLVKANGDEEVVKTSVTTENGVAVTLNDGDTVKIVDNSKDFADVSDNHWGAEAVDFATSRELFAGTSATTFSPDTAMTRGMIVTVLARFEGVDTATGSTWYEAGQQWAMQNGISDGSNMEASLTREQLATMLYRYAQSKGYDTTQGGMAVREYADFDQISGYAVEAMTWAVNTGLISGTSSTTLSPQSEATRAQVATILMRFIETGIQ